MGTWLGIPRPLAGLARPSEAVRNFTPSWFTVVMSCGIVGYLIGGFCAQAPWRRWPEQRPDTAAAPAPTPACRLPPPPAGKFPYDTPAQLEVGWAFWWLTLVLFCTFSIMLASR
jgi:hypothetical protein